MATYLLSQIISAFFDVDVVVLEEKYIKRHGLI